MNRDIGASEKAIAVDVSVSDQTLLGGCRAIYVGTSGDLAVTMMGGGDVTFTAVPVGVISIGVSVVKNSGTTASGIVALL